jgi:acyl carrier protein
MTTHDVLAKIADSLGVTADKITPTTCAADILSWDSMGTMNIMLMLNDDFGVRLPPNQAARLESVDGILTFLREAGKLS